MSQASTKPVHRVQLIAVALLLIMLTLPTALALAVDAPSDGAHSVADTLETLRIDVLPEYDRPATLIVYQAVLPGSVALPALVELDLPPNVATAEMVAEVSGAHELISREYEIVQTHRGALLRFEVSQPRFHVEFYDQLSGIGSAERSYALRWQMNMNVDKLVVVVHEPLAAANLLTIPNGVRSLDEQGIGYVVFEQDQFSREDTVAVALSYVKDNDILTAQGLVERTTTIPDIPSALTADETSLLPWMVVLFALVALAAIIVLAWRVRASTVALQPLTPPTSRPPRSLFDIVLGLSQPEEEQAEARGDTGR